MIHKRNFKSFSKLLLPKLDYNYEDLQPVLSKELVEIHHAKHHQAYITNYNNIFPLLEEAVKSGDTEKIIFLGSYLKFNGGSHINHSIYWTNLAPIKNGGGVVPEKESKLRQHIEKTWGSIEKFQEVFTNKTIAIQGSGWGWLVYDKSTDALLYKELPNQDPVCLTPNQVPLFTVDVWEHAYYLSYKNVRASYVKDIWKIVNWKNIESRYEQGRRV
jgi:Fe-Mn family superoxide dismutase